MDFNELLHTTPDEEGSSSPAQGDHAGPKQDMETILAIVRKINTSLVTSEVLELVLNGAIRISRADRGFLMLADEHRTLQFAVGRTAEGSPIPSDNFQVSSSVLQDVFSTGESLCIENALDDERFEQRRSVVNLELQTILCSPLKTMDDTIGVIYVDSKNIQPVDRAEILNIFEILAGQAAIAIQNARLHENLAKSYNDLTDANEQIVKFERMAMKGEISAEVSHELKNLIAIVLLQLQLLYKRFDSLSPDDVRKVIEQAIKSAERVGNFSANLLSRAHATTNLRTVDPNALIISFVDFIKVLPKFRHTPITIDQGKSVPRTSVDTDQINQVLLNLVNNAIEADPGVALVISTMVDNATGYVQISLQDDGPGISESIKERLFKERVTTKAQGHGYGLPICRQILEHHGGTISAESKPGVGTTLTLSLPPAIEENDIWGTS